jgi:hypothetical protein
MASLLPVPLAEIFHEVDQFLNSRECEAVVERSTNAASGAMPG